MLEDPVVICGALVLVGPCHGLGCAHRRRRGDCNTDCPGHTACHQDVEEHTSRSGNAAVTSHQEVWESSQDQRATQEPFDPPSLVPTLLGT